jgi:hypothetical protein
MDILYVSFCKKHSARTGNILFQYLFAKVICILTENKYQYIPIDEWQQYTTLFSSSASSPSDTIYITDVNAREMIEELQSVSASSTFHNKHIICDGYFQQSDFFIPVRDQLLEFLYSTSNTDYWYDERGNKHMVASYIQHRSPIHFTENDIVISLRLDDFIQLPCSTSDILPPSHYLSILDSIENLEETENIWIVCDTIRHDWERKYIEFFTLYEKKKQDSGKYKFHIQLLQNGLTEDCAIMRECPILIHSNSTLCWIMSFLSTNKIKRYIPNTHFYKSQSLKMIELTDSYYIVSPLTHTQVYQLDARASEYSRAPNAYTYTEETIYSLPYCIPDELIVSTEEALSAKKTVFASVNPRDRTTYIYGPGQEKEYYNMYKEARFAYTCKKGGWDCLRHYEIMANGCIPIFQNIEQCPEKTMCTFPKDLLIHAYKELLPWDENSAEKKMKYAFYLSKMMEIVREYCTCSKMAEYVIETMSIYRTPDSPIRNILLIMGNVGVNYTRELLWIGIQRYIQSVGGIALEYPKIDFLYESYPEECVKGLYGFGYTYSRKLKEDRETTDKKEDEIVRLVQNKVFDLIIYGKMGPDEGWQGTVPQSPLWNIVESVYHKNEIVFLYGGDECFDMKVENRYKTHLKEHSEKGHCFVREYR